MKRQHIYLVFSTIVVLSTHALAKPPIDENRLEEGFSVLIAMLDDPVFRVRETATRQMI